MAKTRRSPAGTPVPAVPRPDGRLDRIDILKKMCRSLEVRRRDFLESAWRDLYADELPQQQFIHLMMLRFSLPCNLNRVMAVTGLSSAGASILVNKLVQFGLLERHDDPADRRNVIISFSPKGEEMCRDVEDRLNRFIYGFFQRRPEAELAAIEQASRIICRVLDDDI
ncbi:MAG: MarR family winged helix-turn-helix transcriptional regulator [Lentisphaeria bacterium]|nr:MarR family winged helix-turn-helix transcriptional regulator [Lentisphaeria bacterium]